MGNEQSQLQGIQIEDKAIQVSPFWSHHSAHIVDKESISSNLSVFIGDNVLFEVGALWTLQTPLEQYTKNLMIYRHPCILKYIHSWQKNSKVYLAVEEATPLSHVLSKLSTLQICIGLHFILKALCFLHDKAQVSHNNVCISAIYVTKDGSWKLGGMEFLCRYKEMWSDYLNKSRGHRYNKAIDPNEENNIKNCNGRKDFVDMFAFASLVKEVLKNKIDESIPVQTFKEFCMTSLQSLDISQKPTFTDILENEFFKHDFIAIHAFLIELPLKSDEEKTQFFQTLGEKLKSFNEDTVASQLGGLLLSRMVLLNKTAQVDLLPQILYPKQGNQDKETSALFSEVTFKKYFTPKLLHIFSVRDAQIRLLLLNHFPHFVQTFTRDELQLNILPELLVGIKDTNDHLVSVTLRTLADLIPILGATTVIGGKRAKLFNDGRPIVHSRKASRIKNEHIKTIHNLIVTPQNDQISVTSSMVEEIGHQILPERPRPDGEEGESSTEVDQSADEDLDNWEDWDNEENISENLHEEIDVVSNGNTSESETNVSLEIRENIVTTMDRRILPDITELDIKNQVKDSLEEEEFNFFQDMEPVIEASSKFLISEQKDGENRRVSDKLTVVEDNGAEEGWGEEDWE